MRDDYSTSTTGKGMHIAFATDADAKPETPEQQTANALTRIATKVEAVRIEMSNAQFFLGVLIIVEMVKCARM